MAGWGSRGVDGCLDLWLGSGQVAKEFEGIDAIGVVFEAGLLGVAEWDNRACGGPPAYDRLDIGMVTGEGGGERLAGTAISIMEDTDRAKGRVVPGQQDRFIGHIRFFIEDQEGQLVVVVVFIFRDLGEVVVFSKGLQQGEEIVVFGYVKLGNVAAAQAKVLIDVVGELFELVHGLIAGQYRD